MIHKKKRIEDIRERQFNFFKLALLSLSFILFSINISAQDSIPEKENLTGEATLKFQQFFFKALSEKSIGNYQKAIENLENCNQILTNDVAVFFEFSKNYLLLNNTLLAKEYIERSLAKDANNSWMLAHLVKIYIKDRNYKEAIRIQQKIIAINPKKRTSLVRLYVYNGQFNEAISLIDSLEKENILSSYLKKVRTNLKARKTRLFKASSVKEVIKPTDLNALVNQFKTDKSYINLKKIIKASSGNTVYLLKYSEEGITLFPSQPYFYLVNGKVLNTQKKHKNALTTLKNGIDFVIDDKMEIDFYNQITKAFKGLGNVKEENKYKQKIKKINIYK